MPTHAPHRAASELVSMLGDWRTPGTPLPRALAEAIGELVAAGLLPVGTRLPPQRQLATALGLSRGSVTAGYGLLQERGQLLATPGSGCRVRSGRGGGPGGGLTGRLFSFTADPQHDIDLSTGALPASAAARTVLERFRLGDLVHYMDTDGYFPGGLPQLRRDIAARLTDDGMPTTPDHVMVTTGAQQATSLVLHSELAPGDRVVVEDPSYRGALEMLRGLGARVRGVPLDDLGVRPDLLQSALARHPTLCYLQTSIHNPTGRTTSPGRRRQVASVLEAAGTLVVEDCCSFDLTLRGGVSPTLAGLVDEDRLISIGTLSKQFWGGLRVGWLRSSPRRVRALMEARKTFDLSTAVTDQLVAVELLQVVDDARRERRQTLTAGVAATQQVLTEQRPDWSWCEPAGGTALWVETGQDTVRLAERARAAGVKLAPGPTFSAHDGFATRLRLPAWHDPEVLSRVLNHL